ncbi:MAG: phosphoribosylanthranilate isomerase [Kiritimatiellia bacterium]
MDVKICGLTNLDDARCAVDAGADYLGFVLYAGSPRGIRIADMARIREGLGGAVRMVAVMVNPSYDEALAAIESSGADVVQVHGAVAYDDFVTFPYPLWRAVAASALHSVPEPQDWPAARYVVDAAVPGQHGGTGVHADWEVAAALAAVYPVMLAGGLKPDMVAKAIRAVRPLGVDVSSGVEMVPGKKDPALVRSFIAKARMVAA